jgi:hypothetical protein
MPSSNDLRQKSLNLSVTPTLLTMKKPILYVLVAILVTGLTSYVFLQYKQTPSFVQKLLNDTPPNKLPMMVILNNMDVKNWSKTSPDSAKFLHQYKIITNADKPRKMKVIITDFMPVSKQLFLKHYRNLDMTIGLKTKNNTGLKTSTIVAPPGYALCIGNKKYGKWQVNTQSGETTWQFHKKYQPLVQSLGLEGSTIQNYDFNNYYKYYKKRRAYYGNRILGFGTGSKFSKNVKRPDSFYQDDRQKRVQAFYYDKDFISSTSNAEYIEYPVNDIIKQTPKNKLPLSVILYDMDVKAGAYFNKYKILTNVDDPNKKQETITIWTQVSKQDFVKNYNNMGMEIASKRIGVNKKEIASKVPAPPGYFNYVGQRQYGQWKTNNDGEAFWSFYGKYMFLSTMFNITTYPIRRSYYSNYRRNYYGRRPYYGGTGSRRMYGTGSTYARSMSSKTYYSSERVNRSREFYREYRNGRYSRSGSRGGYRSRSRSGSSGK